MTQLQILKCLGASDMLPVLSPDIIAFNLGMSRPHVNRLLSEDLREEGYVERVERGKYKLTEKGQEFISH